MFPGRLSVANLADVDAYNFRISRFWWIIGIVMLLIFVVIQRFLLPLWLQPDIDRLRFELQKKQHLATQYQESIDKIPDTLPQQHQYRHSKFSAIMRLLQHGMPDDMRLVSMDWSGSLRIEGESQSRNTISPLRNYLMDSGYFTEVILEQIHQNKKLYNFILLIKFAEDINFSDPADG